MVRRTLNDNYEYNWSSSESLSVYSGSLILGCSYSLSGFQNSIEEKTMTVKNRKALEIALRALWRILK
jgi:hypothetical protein